MVKMICAIVFCIICVVVMFLCLANISSITHSRLGSYHYAHTMMSAVGAIMLAMLVGMLLTAISCVL